MIAQNQIRSERTQRTAAKMSDEAAREIQSLRERPDYIQAYNYFLNSLERGIRPDSLEELTGKPALNLLCIQAPLELIHAAGFLPFKIFSGSYAAGALVNRGMPALVCPLLRSIMGIVKTGGISMNRPWVLPTTCDGTVKFPEILGLSNTGFSPQFHGMDLPTLK
jgi:benzoyl-CoA reductase/2-hydroxyglutaryl-CoA dehydratase subunit BcrC/BadD/HgdB